MMKDYEFIRKEEQIEKIFLDEGMIDVPTSRIDCNYFGDEVIIEFCEEGKIVFTGCYYVEMDHDKNFIKKRPISDLKCDQLDYFPQFCDFSVVKCKNHKGLELELFLCDLNIIPLYLKIMCRGITINDSYKFEL
ncbi:MAG: hypothetical protein PHF46_01860 [Candidatus Gracilibacteria bacterium]|nr:hypothetical protein [Candidatus Gracilibacteria bacterium]